MKLLYRVTIAALVLVFCCSSALAASGVSELLTEYDEDNNGSIDLHEVEEMLEMVLDEPEARAACLNATQLMEEADDNGDNLLNGVEVEHMAAHILPCVGDLTTMKSIHVNVEGVEYECHSTGSVTAHAHRLLRAAAGVATPARRRLAVPDVEIGTAQWECEEAHHEEEEEDDHKLSEGMVWVYGIVASFIASLGSLVGIFLLLPYVSALKNYGDDIAACAMGALLCAVFMHMLPEAVAEVGSFSPGLGVAMLAGFMGSYAVEHIVHISRESVESLVNPECLDSEDHVRHAGHHIMNTDGLDGAFAPALEDGGSVSAHGGAAMSSTSDDQAQDVNPLQAETDAAAAVAVQVPQPGTVAEGEPSTDAVAVSPQASAPTDTAAPSESVTVAVLPQADSAAEGKTEETVVATTPASGHSHAHGHGHSHGHSAKDLERMTKSIDQGISADSIVLAPLVYTVSLGDFFHNLVDGLVIGAAFLGCDVSLGWSVLLAVMLHEVPQELGDFVLLRYSGMSTKGALGVNFITSLGSLFGVVVVLAIGMEALEAVGYFLAFGSGALIFIAATDVLPPLLREKNRNRAIFRVVAMIVAMGLVGLTLLHDVHCEEGGHAHAH